MPRAPLIGRAVADRRLRGLIRFHKSEKFLRIPQRHAPHLEFYPAGKGQGQVGAAHTGSPGALCCGQADIRVKHTDAVQVEPLLPPQGHAALPQPEALPPVASRGPGQQCPKEEGGDEQGHGQLGQHCGRDQRQQQAEGKGNACRCKKDETALLGAGQQVGRHPELRQQFPEQCLLAAAVDKQRQLG